MSASTEYAWPSEAGQLASDELPVGWGALLTGDSGAEAVPVAAELGEGIKPASVPGTLLTGVLAKVLVSTVVEPKESVVVISVTKDMGAPVPV